MASTPRVQSIVMPHDGSLPYKTDFLLVTPGTSDISIVDCQEDEELLGLIPKIWAPPEWHGQKFSWDHRSVTVISAQDIEDHGGGDWRETYLLYTCADEGVGTWRKFLFYEESLTRVLLTLTPFRSCTEQVPGKNL